MARAREYKDNAEKQRAYRARLKARAATPVRPQAEAPADTLVTRVMAADAIAARAMGEA